ncbi:hypothetical protein ACJVC5_01990 [Peredibacter sp. HCB2-198]|uniref:hypothetical protein n=1 Tax=Peredibacter sp. HCB2-198 TaxID=3383025 RepID=UPI0038B60FED
MIVTIFNEDRFKGTRDGIENLLTEIAKFYGKDVLITQENRYFGNKWKERQSMDLAAMDAAKALLVDEAIIIYSDADTKWSNYKSVTDENYLSNKTFFDRLVQKIKEKLEFLLKDGDPDINPQEIEKCLTYSLGRIILLSPCWNIESWSYFNKDEFKKISTRYKLDEVINPIIATPHGNFEEKKMSVLGEALKKTSTSQARKDTFNEELLSTSFPIQALYDVDKYFKVFVDDFIKML